MAAGTAADLQDAGLFDYIVVGAGSAGCVLANRLTADPKRSVLVLEAGGMDDWIWFHIPVGYLFAIGNPRADWMFRTEPQPGLNGRAIAYPRGKVIGGSSAINAMIYMRGQAADSDGWRQLGLPGWGWADVLPAVMDEASQAQAQAIAMGRATANNPYPALLEGFLGQLGDAGIQLIVAGRLLLRHGVVLRPL